MKKQLHIRRVNIYITYVVLHLSIIIGGSAFGQIVNTVYLSKADSTKNMYLAIPPLKPDSAKGVILLVPGAFQSAREVLLQSNLPEYASKNGFYVFVVIPQTGVQSMAIDDSTQSSLKEIVELCVKTNKLENKPFFIGGFSSGGTSAIKYTELATKNNYSVIPKAVFAIDPPLDYERYYNSAKRSLRLFSGKIKNDELEYMVAKIEKLMGGTPQENIANYYKYSPYSFSDSTQSAVKNLTMIPITVYSEPDINWWLTNRAFDYENLNIIDGAALINELHLQGNQNARLVTTDKKGFRLPSHTQHPHSWSILDPAELINWLNSIIK